MLLSFILCTYFGVAFFKNLNLQDRGCWIWIRRMSVLMYGFHGLFTEILKIYTADSAVFFVLVLAATYAAGVLILFMQKHIKWLKILY